MAGQRVVLRSSGLAAEVAAAGAEVVALRDAEGRALLWSGDPAVWSGQAPLLFPIVGRLRDDALAHEGRTYPMKQHGFARRSEFELLSVSETDVVFRLSANDATREQYPFEFVLDMRYALEGDVLAMVASVSNPGAEALPLSFGFHPGFLWPLPYGGGREEHQVLFEEPERAPVHRPVGGLLSDAVEPNPAASGVLALDDGLFQRDALIFRSLRSQRLRFGVPGRPGLEVGFEGMPQLGLWSKPGAPFLCIEPWHGYASPENHTGAFRDKPGLVLLPPGQQREFAMTVRRVADVVPFASSPAGS